MTPRPWKGMPAIYLGDGSIILCIFAPHAWERVEGKLNSEKCNNQIRAQAWAKVSISTRCFKAYLQGKHRSGNYVKVQEGLSQI